MQTEALRGKNIKTLVGRRKETKRVKSIQPMANQTAHTQGARCNEENPEPLPAPPVASGWLEIPHQSITVGFLFLPNPCS